MDKTAYKRAFDAISAPETAESAVLDRIAPGHRRAVPRMALVLCAVLILTCSAAVASGLNGGWLGSIISLNGNDVPAGNLQEISQTVESDGLRMTLVSAASDGMHTYLLVDVEALDGQDFSHEESADIPLSDSIYVDCRLLMEGSGGYGFRFFRLDDGSDPARAQLALRFSSGVSCAGQQMELVMNSLKHSVMVPHEGKMLRADEPIAEGEWRFAFRLNDHLESVRYTLDSFDVSISALGISIDGAGCGKLLKQSLSLKMTDGTLSDLSGAGYHALKSNHTITSETIEAETTELIDPNKVAALIIGSTEYELTPVR